MSSSKKMVDWEVVERHYRAGMLSLREIANEAGVTEGAIRKRAKRDQWSRSLADKIQQRADDLVRKELVRKPGTQLTQATEKEVIDANAAAVVSVRMSHRSDIAALRKRAADYQAELDESTDELGKRVQILKMLSETQKSLITSEREAYGLDNEQPGAGIANAIGDLIKSMGRSSLPVIADPQE